MTTKTITYMNLGVLTRHQWKLHIDNLYEAMLADQVCIDTLDLSSRECQALGAKLDAQSIVDEQELDELQAELDMLEEKRQRRQKKKGWHNIYTWRQWELHIDNLSVEELQRDHAALTKKARELWQEKKDKKDRLFHSYNMKSWRNVYTRRQWRLHIDNLYEAMLADQVYQDTLDIAEYEAVHALMHGR